jgi:hypothetical protein
VREPASTGWDEGEKCSDYPAGNFGKIALDPDGPGAGENVYRRSGDKAIIDYFRAKGSLPYASDAQKAQS